MIVTGTICRTGSNVRTSISGARPASLRRRSPPDRLPRCGAGAFDYGAFDYQVACAGDVNGDGYADLAVGAEWASPSGSAFVYLGGATGLAAPPATALVGPDGPHGYFGVSVFGASD